MKKVIKLSPYLMHSTMLKAILSRGDKLVVDTDTWLLSVVKSPKEIKLYYISKNQTYPLPLEIIDAVQTIRELMCIGNIYGKLFSPQLSELRDISVKDDLLQHVAYMINKIVLET